MRCLLVENYSNSRQVWSSRSFLQFLCGLRPNKTFSLPVHYKLSLQIPTSSLNLTSFCYPKGCATPSFVPCQGNTWRPLEQAQEDTSPEKINVTSKFPVGNISVVTLIRTDTTLDHSQKAEKVWSIIKEESFVSHKNYIQVAGVVCVPAQENWTPYSFRAKASQFQVSYIYLLPSQRSLHDAPIFRLLLKVAVNGTHQCDFLNFCGPFKVQLAQRILQATLSKRPAKLEQKYDYNAEKSMSYLCWQKLASYLPLKKFCYGWLHRRLLRRYRPQSAVNCSTLWERAAGSPPNTSQVSLNYLYRFMFRFHLLLSRRVSTACNTSSQPNVAKEAL